MFEKTYSMSSGAVSQEQPAKNTFIPVLSTAVGSWRFSVEREPLSDTAITKRYDQKAGHWTRILGMMGYLSAYGALMDALFANGHLHSFPDDPWVLDAGTGSGALSLAFNAAHTKQYPGGMPMFSAIDRSPEMLQIAQHGFDAARLNAAIHNYDVCQLPWEENTFDFAMAAHVIEHLPSPLKALQEMVRVLQPGAPLLLILTKKSFLGALVQMNWRVHGLAYMDVRLLLDQAGLVDVQFLPLQGLLCNQMSTACVARKAPEVARANLDKMEDACI